MSMPARQSAAAIAALILFALILRVVLTLPENDNSVLLAVWNLGRFFTILTNTLAMVTLGLVAIGARPGALWCGAVTLAIALVGVVYHFLLAHLVDFQGWARVADLIVHYASPALMALWWVAFAPKGPLDSRTPLVWVIWPLVYCAYAVGRGLVDGLYPYPFLNLGELGWGGLAISVGGLIVAFLIGGAVVLALAKALDR